MMILSGICPLTQFVCAQILQLNWNCQIMPWGQSKILVTTGVVSKCRIIIFRDVDEKFVIFSLFQPFFTCSYSFCDFLPSVVINFFLQHCHCQHPPHEGCTSVLVATPLALICKVQFIIHLNNKEYLIQILCDSIFLSILQI